MFLRSFALLGLIWVSLLAGAIVVGHQSWEASSALATQLRMGSSVTLAATGAILYLLLGRSRAGFPVFCIGAGMVLGTIGDFFNARLLDFIPLPDPVLGAIVAFGLGHIAYMIGFIAVKRRAGLTNHRALFAAIIAWQILGLAAWAWVVLPGTKARALVWPSLPYTALLAGTAGLATGLGLQNRRLAWLALGAALFFTSDLILAYGIFRESLPHHGDWVWLTYGPGQMLIVFSGLAIAKVSEPEASARVL